MLLRVFIIERSERLTRGEELDSGFDFFWSVIGAIGRGRGDDGGVGRRRFEPRTRVSFAHLPSELVGSCLRDGANDGGLASEHCVFAEGAGVSGAKFINALLSADDVLGASNGGIGELIGTLERRLHASGKRAELCSVVEFLLFNALHGTSFSKGDVVLPTRDSSRDDGDFVDERDDGRATGEHRRSGARRCSTWSVGLAGDRGSTSRGGGDTAVPKLVLEIAAKGSWETTSNAKLHFFFCAACVGSDGIDVKSGEDATGDGSIGLDSSNCRPSSFQ